MYLPATGTVFLTKKVCFRYRTVLWSPDFFAGAGEKNSAPGCCCVTYRFFGGDDTTILNILVRLYQLLNKLKEKIDRYRYTFKKAKLFNFIFLPVNCIFYLNLSKKIYIWSRVKIGPTPQHW